MDLFMKFLFEFMSQFFGGLMKIIKGLFSGIVQMFNIVAYYDTIKLYANDITIGVMLSYLDIIATGFCRSSLL